MTALLCHYASKMEHLFSREYCHLVICRLELQFRKEGNKEVVYVCISECHRCFQHVVNK